MSKNVSDHLVERLHAWGVRSVFGYPGDGVNGLMGAFQRASEKIRFIQKMCREQEGSACVSLTYQNVPDLPSGNWIKARRYLVNKADFAVSCEHHG